MTVKRWLGCFACTLCVSKRPCTFRFINIFLSVHGQGKNLPPPVALCRETAFRTRHSIQCTERDRLPQDAVCQKFDKFDNFRLRVTNALSRNCDNCPNPNTNLTPNPIFSLLLLQPFAFRNQKYRPTTKTTLKFQDVSGFLSLIGQ